MAIQEHPFYIPLEENAIIWRYMNLKKFEDILAKKALFFCRADKFTDLNEGAIPKKETENRLKAQRQVSERFGNPYNHVEASKNIIALDELHKGMKRGTLVNCWHINRFESGKMWELYVGNDQGVTIQSNKERIERCFGLLTTNIEMSKVRYLDYENDIWFHKDEFPHYSYTAITPLIHKKLEFEHEAEFRVFLINNEAIKKEDYWNDSIGMDVNINVEDLIEKVIVPPNSDLSFKNKIELIIEKYGFDFKVEKSTFSG